MLCIMHSVYVASVVFHKSHVYACMCKHNYITYVRHMKLRNYMIY